MKIQQIIDELDTLDVRMLNDRRYFARFAHFLNNTYNFLNTALMGKNDEENFDGDRHIDVSSELLKSYATPERVAKLFAIADYFSYQANQKKYIKALIPAPVMKEEEGAAELEDYGINVPEEFRLHPGNVFRTHRGVVELYAGAQAAQQNPALNAFADHIDTVLDYLQQQEGEHAIEFTHLKADLIVIREQARNQQQLNPPAEGLNTVKAVQYFQKKCDHAMLSAIHSAKREAPAVQSLVMRILDAIQRLFKEHIPSFMHKISGTRPTNPLYEYRFRAVRNNSDTPWMKKMEIVAVSHERHKAP